MIHHELTFFVDNLEHVEEELLDINVEGVVEACVIIRESLVLTHMDQV